MQGFNSPTSDEVLETVCKAVLEANYTYAEMSGGSHIHDAGVEAFLSVNIAQALLRLGRAKFGSAYATLETGIQYIEQDSCAAPVRGVVPDSMRRDGRVDVVYWDEMERPIGLIEAKRWFSWSLMRDDVLRLTHVLKRCGPDRKGSARWGCVSGLSRSDRDSRVDAIARLSKFVSEFKSSSDMEFKQKVLTHTTFYAADGLHPVWKESGILDFSAVAIVFGYW